MRSRTPLFAFALTRATKRQLEQLAMVLGKSQAAVLTQCIRDLWASLSPGKRRALARIATIKRKANLA